MKKSILATLALLASSARVSAAQAWTPLITSADFTGPRTDMLTAVGGVITFLLIIVGIAYLSKIFR